MMNYLCDVCKYSTNIDTRVNAYQPSYQHISRHNVNTLVNTWQHIPPPPSLLLLLLHFFTESLANQSRCLERTPYSSCKKVAA